MTTFGAAGWLLAAAGLNALAALIHVGVIVGGPDWYRLFGAGEGMARLAAQGSWYPALATGAIALVLAAWAAYALSGAGALPRLPLLRLALVAITAVYLLRGVAGLLLAASATGGNSPAFWLWLAVCLAIGGVHAVGVCKAWPGLAVGPS